MFRYTGFVCLEILAAFVCTYVRACIKAGSQYDDSPSFRMVS